MPRSYTKFVSCHCFDKSFLMGDSRPLLFIFVHFKHNIFKKYCRFQQDLNWDRQSRRGSCWPLNHHHVPMYCRNYPYIYWLMIFWLLSSSFVWPMLNLLPKLPKWQWWKISTDWWLKSLTKCEQWSFTCNVELLKLSLIVMEAALYH